MVKELLVIGGGKMGEALVRGLLDAGWAKPEQVVIVEVAPARRAELAGPGGLASRFAGLEVVEGARRRPRVPSWRSSRRISESPAEYWRAAGVSRVLSIAAGVTLGDLESFCPGAPLW